MFYRLFRWLNIFLIVVTLLGYLAPYVNPNVVWPVSLLGLAYPWLLLFNLLFIVAWLIARNRYFLMSLTCVLLGFSHLTNFVGIEFATPAVLPGSIRVMSYNIYDLRGLPKTEGERSEEKALSPFWEFLTEAGPFDILCTQESGIKSTKKIAEHLKMPYFHQFPDRGTGIISRYPIINKGQIDFEKTNNSCIWADIEIDGKVLRVYSLHLQSNFISSQASQIAKEGDLQEKETWVGIKGILGKYKHFAGLRVQQATRVEAHIKGSPHPVILCGDFNDTPLSKAYHILSENMVDGFQEKGHGIGTTYGGLIPTLRIDYILHDPRFTVLEYRTFREDYSDHYPVYARLKLYE
ncbi:MAG: endonuclease/exonuclease/phosphatase family protein [Saprospiraceae bacterium]|nr:endonuclease/exonuclease/phosphatase family protein [Saprospiraceae bacterium]